MNGSREISSRLNFHFGLQRLGFLRAALGTGTWAEGVERLRGSQSFLLLLEPPGGSWPGSLV